MNETGWNERNEIFFGLSSANSDHRAHLLVVDAVDDRDDRNDVDAVRVQVLDRPQLHIEQVADGAMRIGGVADPVELQIGIAQTGFGGLRQNSGLFANSIPLVAACTLL